MRSSGIVGFMGLSRAKPSTATSTERQRLGVRHQRVEILELRRCPNNVLDGPCITRRLGERWEVR